MSDSYSFQRAAGGLAVASAFLAIGNLIASLAAVDFDFNAFTDPMLLLQAGADRAITWRWAMILDVLGYYLFIVPLTLFVWRWLSPKSPNWMGLFACCVLAYSLIGALGAAILAAAVPPMMVEYAHAAEAQRLLIEPVFRAIMDAVNIGLWNILEEFIVGIGWLGMGYLLRPERRALGIITMVLGGTCLADSFGVVLGIGVVAETALFIYLILAIVWAFWFGFELLRAPALIPQPEPARERVHFA